jgi:hypothetical protein
LPTSFADVGSKSQPESGGTKQSMQSWRLKSNTMKPSKAIKHSGAKPLNNKQIERRKIVFEADHTKFSKQKINTYDCTKLVDKAHKNESYQTQMESFNRCALIWMPKNYKHW